MIRRLLARSRPTLSVIIPVHDVERYLALALDSVLGQDVTGLEVIVVDDGSTDGSPEIIARYAARDRRLRAIRQENAGQGAARNRGVAVARGEFLTFVDADDVVPRGAYDAMLRTLRRSGSDFVVGAARRLRDDGQQHFPPWHGLVHGRDRIGITVDEFPSTLADIIACNRVFRRSFWTDRVGGFLEGIIYEDHVPMVAAYLRAARFDLITTVTYDWRIRGDRSSTGQRKEELRNLTDRLTVMATAHRLVRTEASETVRAAWLGRVIDTDLTPYLDHALRGDDEYRSRLQAGLGTYVRAALDEPAALAHVRVRQKIRTYLAAAGAWDQLEIAQRFFRDFTSLPPTRVADGRILIRETLSSLLDVGIPPQLLELSRHETRLQACTLRAEWSTAGTLRLTGWALIRGLDLAGRSPRLDLWMADEDGARVQLPVEAASLPEATRWAGWPHGSFDVAGFRTTIDVAELARAAKLPTEWSLRVRVSVDGVEREDGVYHPIEGGSASRAAVTSQRVSDAGTLAVPRHDRSAGLVIALRTPDLVAERLASVGRDRVIRGSVRLRSSVGSISDVRIRSRADGTELAGAVTAGPDGEAEFSLRLPDSHGPVGSRVGSAWELRAADADGRERAVEWPVHEDRTRIPGAPGEEPMRWQRSPRGYVQLIVGRPLVSVTDVAADAETLRMTVAADEGLRGSLTDARLSCGAASVPASSVEDGAPDRFVITLPLLAAASLPPRALPSGSYRVELAPMDGNRAELDPAYAATLPRELRSETHLIRVAIAGQRELQVDLSAPLADDERSARDRWRLERDFIAVEPQPETAVLFHGPTKGLLLELHDAVRSKRPDLPTIWSVPDLATGLPKDAVPVVIGSRDWHRRLASARFLATERDLDAFFVKRAHQRLVRIFDLPANEPVGLSAWWDEGFTPAQIADEIARRNEWWDAILVPDASAVVRYRREFSYEGPVLVGGQAEAARILETLIDRD